MTPYMAIFAAALVLGLAITPVARLVALSTGVVDRPAARKLHTNVMPLMGGVAIYLACSVALLAFGDRFYLAQVVWILLGATTVSFLGLWDDRFHVPAYAKLLGQVVAAGILVYGGVQVEFLRVDALNVIATVAWVVGITNAMNLLDNMDGLSGGIAAVAAAFFFLLAAGSGQLLVGSLAAALLGASLGFLYYNFNPARIFMGDSGSLFIGFILAAVGIKLRFASPDFVTWMVPLFVLAVPLFDTTLVIVSRVRRGLNPLTHPGKDHVSHRLVALGWTHREAVMALYLVAGGGGMVAIFLTRASVLEGYATGLLGLVLGILALVRLEWRGNVGLAHGDSHEKAEAAGTSTPTSAA